MRIAMFGGSFDPVHWGHLLLAETAMEACRLDRVLFVPAGTPPHKPRRQRAPGRQRAALLELAIAGHEAWAVDRFEIERDEISYTVDTLRHLRATYRGSELFFMIGADMYFDLPNWRESEEIRRLARPIVVARPGWPRPDVHPAFAMERHTEEPADALLVEMPQIDLSSTEIRCRVAQGRSIRFRVPRAVEESIRTSGLYLEPRDGV